MEKDIGKIKKNDQSDIIIRIDDFADKRGLTIREFVTSERYTGFTKAGVRILAADFKKFKEMINSISEEDMKDELPADQETLDEAVEDAEEQADNAVSRSMRTSKTPVKVKLTQEQLLAKRKIDLLARKNGRKPLTDSEFLKIYD